MAFELKDQGISDGNYHGPAGREIRRMTLLGEKVLVTGATGFLGGALTRRLAAMAHK